MFFKYNLLLSEEDFNDLLHSLKFNQSIFDDKTKIQSSKLIDYFMKKSKIIKQQNMDMVTIYLSDLQMQELVIQLSTTNAHFLNREQFN